MNTHLSTCCRTSTTNGPRVPEKKVQMKRLQELAKRISTVPEAVEMQSRVAKIYGDCQAMAAGEKLFDWGWCGENLAYATLVDEGIPVRLSGEDSVVHVLPPPRGDPQPV